MSGGCFFDAVLSDDERRRRVYAGDVFLHSPTAASLALVGLARELLAEAFAGEQGGVLVHGA